MKPKFKINDKITHQTGKDSHEEGVIVNVNKFSGYMRPTYTIETKKGKRTVFEELLKKVK